MSKNPYISGILNFFLLGPGYIYNGKRIALGVGFTIAALLATFVESQLANLDQTVFLVSFTSFFILALSAAYDGYQEAKDLS